MFRNKTTCPSCLKTIDILNVDCPYCQTHNNEYDKLKLSSNAVNVAWYFQLIFFAVGWMGIQIIASIIQVAVLFISRVPVEEFTSRMDILAPVEFITYGLELVIMIILLFISKGYKQVRRPFTDIIEGEKTYITGILGVVVIFILSIVYELFRQNFNTSTNTNQALIETMVKTYPILCLIFFGIIGPFCEELTYRVGLFGLLRRWNRVGAILLSAFIFAFIHFDISSLLLIVTEGDFNPIIDELWNFPSYLIGGLGLVLLYDLFGFGASTTAHILNNVMSIGQIMVVCHVIR
ncbi:MAG: CPBP family intramembrane metalloprotease [Bacilli bacterium]|nr:CPBP family intramembrane metalloprotease [Bacilli bacterium]